MDPRVPVLVGLASFAKPFASLLSTQTFKIVRNELSCDPIQVLRHCTRHSNLGGLLFNICEAHHRLFWNETAALVRFIEALSLELCKFISQTHCSSARIVLALRDCVTRACRFLRQSPPCVMNLDRLDSHQRVTVWLQHHPKEKHPVLEAAAKVVVEEYAGQHPDRWDFGPILLQPLVAVPNTENTATKTASATNTTCRVVQGVMVQPLDQHTLDCWRRCSKPEHHHAFRTVVLLKNDLSKSAFHLGPTRSSPGLKQPSTVMHRPSQLAAFAHRESQAFFDHLAHQFKGVDLLLCSGIIPQDVQWELAVHLGLLVLPQVSLRNLEALSRRFDLPIFNDIGQAALDAPTPLCDEISIQPEGPDSLLLSFAKRVGAAGLQNPVSVLLISRIPALLLRSEQTFWSAMFSLKHLERDGAFLVGDGSTERDIATALLEAPAHDGVNAECTQAFANALCAVATLRSSFQASETQTNLIDMAAFLSLLNSSLSFFQRALFLEL